MPGNFMKTGRISEQIFQRSVSKKIENFSKNGAAGDDCAVSALKSCQAQVVYTRQDCCKYGIHRAVNRLAAAGWQPRQLLLSLLLPVQEKEEGLRLLMEGADRAAKETGAVIADVEISVTEAVNRPVLTVTALGGQKLTGSGMTSGAAANLMEAGISKAAGMGAATKAAANAKSPAVPGMEIVMTKWAGLEGSAILAAEQAQHLLQRYPAYLIEEAAAFDRQLSVLPEAAVAAKSDVVSGCAAAEGGIFRGLWTLASQAGVGLEIMLKKIPIRQETVEICNFLDINPYELAAGGSLLCITGRGEALVGELAKAGIPAAVIGTVTDNNDRVIVNGQERRFLEPAKEDEIFKIK